MEVLSIRIASRLSRGSLRDIPPDPPPEYPKIFLMNTLG
ncbi:hypothetical protein [Pseudomonas phage PhL_UNISO_PA-DSM_ph0041x]|nr:hypothetical protein [Pseudomonas phage PhL_UNISO_PA-DSM_ph0041x]